MFFCFILLYETQRRASCQHIFTFVLFVGTQKLGEGKDSNNFANFELEGTLVANLAITLSTLAGIAAFSQLKNPILIVSFVRVPARV